MPRLGSVLGSILAELARARVVADTLSRDLVDEYRADPILASLSVPRISIDRAELTLRFAVSDLTEVQPGEPVDREVADRWVRHVASSVLPELLRAKGLEATEANATLERLVGSREAPSIDLPQDSIRDALRGDAAASARTTTDAVLSGWDGLPAATRKRLGTKAAFEAELRSRLTTESTPFIGRVGELEFVRAALASRMDIGIRSNDLSTQPEQIQELKLTLRGEDVSLIIETIAER